VEEEVIISQPGYIEEPHPIPIPESRDSTDSFLDSILLFMANLAAALGLALTLPQLDLFLSPMSGRLL